MRRNAILLMVFFAETFRASNLITKLYFPLLNHMECSILNYVILIILSLVSSSLKPHTAVQLLFSLRETVAARVNSYLA